MKAEASTIDPGDDAVNAPAESYGKLFLRFLRFGSLAWGGPVAQIDMIRQELVAEEKWVSPGHFKRLLAIYQVLPGPEAHELCVHFGMLSRGPLGGVLAGLAFMLPGFVLMFLLSWLYLSLNITATAFQAVFLGIQPAVIALIVRACHRIGGHSFTNGPLWAIGILAAVGELLGVSFYITLPLAGIAYVVAAKRRWAWTGLVALVFGVAVFQLSPVIAGRESIFQAAQAASTAETRQTGQATPGALLGSGLRAGLLTFGGAYTAIPFLKEDAVERGRWMSERDFLDGVALSGILPAADHILNVRRLLRRRTARRPGDDGRNFSPGVSLLDPVLPSPRSGHPKSDAAQFPRRRNGRGGRAHCHHRGHARSVRHSRLARRGDLCRGLTRRLSMEIKARDSRYYARRGSHRLAVAQLKNRHTDTPTIGLLLYGTDAQPRNAATEDKYRLLVEKMVERRWEVRTLSYHDSWRDALHREACLCDAVLAWINPTEPQLDRPALDAFLRELAGDGVLVSAHPDTILRIGTKDVLVTTQALGWSVQAVAHRSLADFRERFPSLVRRDGARVLKQYRGHSGQGVWKVSALSAHRFEVRPAARGEPPCEVTEDGLFAFFDAEIFARGSHLVNQRWVSTMDRGMVRAYLCGTKVAGFGYQEIVALYPAIDNDFTRQQPSRRYYYTENCFLFQRLRQRLEQEWVPALQELMAMRAEEFPLLWDADFFVGDPPDAEFSLCEINASCVSPFPESAITPLIAELERRLAYAQPEA
jgi:putative chromate ion transporter